MINNLIKYIDKSEIINNNNKLYLTLSVIKEMNRRKPVELSEKIDYLNEKIFKVHAEIRKSDDLELRLNFQQFIDTCITEILGITENSGLNNEDNGGAFVLS